MTTLDRLFLQRYRQQASALLGPRLLQMRLFGSRARGDFRPDSDLDLLVLVDRADEDTRRCLSGLAYDLSMEMGLHYGVSLQVQSHEHFQGLIRHETLFARDILEQGVAV